MKRTVCRLSLFGLLCVNKKFDLAPPSTNHNHDHESVDLEPAWSTHSAQIPPFPVIDRFRFAVRCTECRRWSDWETSPFTSTRLTGRSVVPSPSDPWNSRCRAKYILTISFRFLNCGKFSVHCAWLAWGRSGTEGKGNMAMLRQTFKRNLVYCYDSLISLSLAVITCDVMAMAYNLYCH